MSLYTTDLIDIPLEVFGGYCPAIPPSDLAPGAAGVAQDVIYPQGALRSRGGLFNFFPGSPIPNNAAVNGLKTYITPTLQQRLMVWDSLSNLYKESPQGTLNLLFSRPGYPGLFYQSVSLFGREYQAFFNSLGGADIPRQYDDTFWDRISQVGPGSSPNAADEQQVYNINASPNGLVNLNDTIQAAPTGLTAVGNLVTLKASGAGAFTGALFGDQILVAGAGIAGYNGTWTISNVIDTNTVQFEVTTTGLAASGGGTVQTEMAVVTPSSGNFDAVTTMEPVVIAGAGVGGYNGTWQVRKLFIIAGHVTQVAVIIGSFGLANSGNGTMTLAGNVVAGRHQVSLAFVTRQGFITQAAPPNFWIAGGSKRVALSNIAIGPPNVVARLVLFTPVITPPATTGSFYSMPTGNPQLGTSAVMLIQDNSTTQAVFDFTDTILIASFQANYLFTQLELGESACMMGYNSRIVALGERNKVTNFVNLTFDGGFNGNLPDGWTLGGAGLNGGGSSALTSGLTADWGDAYTITGDGATAERGLIVQSAYQDYLQVPIIARATAYGVRARIRKTGGLTQGTIHVNLTSVLGGFTTVGLAVTAAQLSSNFQEFTANLTDTPIASPPTDLQIQVYADGTPTAGGQFTIDSIEPYPLTAPFNFSTARLSHAFNPESFDGTTGQIQVRPSDGQQLTAGFPLRNNLYLAKNHYLCYVTDDGVNEPSGWAVNEVSGTIGICGSNAVDWTEEWAVFAERAGLHVCWGSDPVKVTPEIQTDASGTGKISWQSINWSAAYTVWVRIDKVNKKILIGAPVNGATTPNVVFMMDYQWLENAQDIANSPLVTYSAFTGKILAHGRGRRWATWSITANSMTFAERTDGTAQPFFGNGVGNGKIYEQLDASVQPSDDGVAVPWSYQGYGMPSHLEEQQYQMGAHRKLFGYMKFRAIGSGSFNLAVSTTLRSTLLRSYVLSLTPAGDGERPLNIHGERFFMSVRVNTSATAWFQLEKWIACVKKDAAFVVRGVSA